MSDSTDLKIDSADAPIEFQRVRIQGEAPSKSEKKTKRESSEPGFLIPAITGALIGASIAIAVTMTLLDSRLAQVQTQIASIENSIPQFRIVDTAAMAIEQEMRHGEDPEARKVFFQNAKAKIQELRADGVLLFDASVMVGFPPEYAIGPEVLAPRKGGAQ